MKFALGVPATASASLRLPAVTPAPAMLILSRAVPATGSVDLFLEQSTDLQQWTDVPLDWTKADSELDLETLALTMPAAPGPAYFRMRAVLR